MSQDLRFSQRSLWRIMLLGYNALYTVESQRIFFFWRNISPWRWRRRVPPTKRRLTFNGLHVVVSQKMKLLKINTVREILIRCRHVWLYIRFNWNVKNYRVFVLCPSSGIIETREHNVSETASVSVLRWEGEGTYFLGPLERANLNHWTHVSSPITWGRKRIHFPKLCVL
jgi:hypothetical protein